ncbi:MAG: hypothetical protein KatS3mg076_1439 [Candidatus Binatia bacterium]|nr:MAG: hypothetical protein KatS3mg076_1439 [Candidatus Binatia bacterium]
MARSTARAEGSNLWTLEEWASLDEDMEGELVDGALEEEEVPSVLHELVVTWLAVVLRRWVGKRGGFLLGSEAKIAVGPRRGRKPDLSVFLPPRLPSLADTLVRVAPHMVVEVTSSRPRDIRRDRLEKVADYARAGVHVYAILDPQLRSLEVYELGVEGRYTIALAAGGGRVGIPGCPGLTVNLDALWEEVEKADRAQKKNRGRFSRK